MKPPVAVVPSISTTVKHRFVTALEKANEIVLMTLPLSVVASIDD